MLESDELKKISDSEMAATLAPVKAQERISAIDTLRGFAMLGILVINLPLMALPGAIFYDPSIIGGFEGLNFIVWIASTLLFQQKFMTIFSLLFGGGLILMVKRAEENGVSFGKIYYRRLLWLWLFGLLNAYLLWYGDVLFPYALCGLLLYPMRKFSPKKLIIIGSLIFLVTIPLMMGFGFGMDFLKTEYNKAEETLSQGKELSTEQQTFHNIWKDIESNFNPSEERIEEEIEKRRSDFWTMLEWGWIIPFVMQTQAFAFFIFWRVLGLMLIGMALMKMGILSAERSKKFYLILMVIGYGVGLSGESFGIWQLLKNDFDIIYSFMIGNTYEYIFSIFVALGHISLVMLICKSGLFTWLKKSLAAVGRMALTNYILQGALLIPIFFGFGFGLFARFERIHLIGFLIAVWIIQLIISPLWLKYYRFGPMEWLWRSLTYWKIQPMRK